MADKELTSAAVRDVVDLMIDEGITFNATVVRNPAANTEAAIKDKSRLDWVLMVKPLGSNNPLSTIWGYCSTETFAYKLRDVAMQRMIDRLGSVNV